MFTSEALNLTINTFMVFSLLPFWTVYFRAPLAIAKPLPRTRVSYIDFLKGFAIISVILLHVVFYFAFVTENTHPFFLAVVNNLLRYSISFFLICSGVLVAAYNHAKIKIWEYWRSKIIRVFIPYIIMTILVTTSRDWSFVQISKSLFFGDALIPYYFVVVLFYAYLIFPYIQKVKNNKAFLIFSFFVTFISAFLTDLTQTLVWLPTFLKYGFFFFYGVYVSNYFFQEKISKKESFFWWSFVFMYILIFMTFPDFYYNVRLFYGVAVFNLFVIYKNTIIKMPSLIYNAIVSFGKNSLWIFLTHFPIVYVIFLFFLWLKMDYYLTFVCISVVSIFVCYFIGRWSGILYNKALDVLRINR